MPSGAKGETIPKENNPDNDTNGNITPAEMIMELEIETHIQDDPNTNNQQTTQLANLQINNDNNNHPTQTKANKRKIEQTLTFTEKNTRPKPTIADQPQAVTKINPTYTKKHPGPYKIFIQPNTENNTIRLNPTLIGRILAPKYPNDIDEIKSIGQRRVAVILKNIDAANKLINDPVLTVKNLTAFIPKHCIEKSGIIKGVPILK